MDFLDDFIGINESIVGLYFTVK
ncbi:hypothetical protein BRAS3843_2550023 [Bradyrhizobium sp. STM 3843]|nr:hypothetical protein BRAS3843_2550023 [Bradyrhizobium sp. STM 3843]